MARTIALYGETGDGKTTQIGDYGKSIFKQSRRRFVLRSTDLGGHDSINPLIKLGVGSVERPKQNDDPWEWIANAAERKPDKDVGLVAFDSGTSMSEFLLNSCAKLSAAGEDIGGRPAPKFIIGKRGPNPLKIGTNVDSHYMVVQGFMLDVIFRSTWLAEGDVDVIWTFSLYRGENAASDPILGPKLAGKALTSAIPKWFKYTFRLASIPVVGSAPRHVLYIQAQPDNVGIATSYGNSRYPLDATTQLPAMIEPASLTEAIKLIESGQDEAEANLKAELGL